MDVSSIKNAHRSLEHQHHPGHVPSVFYSIPWIVGWVWLSVTGSFFGFRLLMKVCSGLYLRYQNSRNKLLGKVVLITGASSGLGAAIATQLYSRGCKLILVARSIDKLQALKAKLMTSLETQLVNEPILVELDITDLNRVSEVLSNVISKLPGQAVDILINNAGQSYRGCAAATLIDVDLKVMLINYFGHIAVTKAVLPGMLKKRSGHILSVSSIQGRLAIPFRSCYAASKHALQGYMDSLRSEVASKNITVSVLSPGYIATNLSLNAVTAQGSIYGKMDSTTAKGMSPQTAAEHVMHMLLSQQQESLLCPWHYRLALVLRCLFPDAFFFIMKRRAANELPDTTSESCVSSCSSATNSPESHSSRVSSTEKESSFHNSEEVVRLRCNKSATEF